MKENIIKSKSYDLALSITMVYKHLTQEQRDFIIAKEILQNGTSIGILVSEAQRSQSVPDSVHKMHLALKATKETEYWLRLLIDSDYIPEKSFDSIYDDCVELEKLITAIVETTENK